MATTQPDHTPRRTIATFERYQDAEALVNRLARVGFPVERVVIVGRDLELAEQVTGSLTAGRIAVAGLASGLILGALLGLLFGLFFPGIAAVAELLYWAIVGALVGFVAGGALFWLSGGQRTFSSVTRMLAGRYDVMVDEALADEVLRVLGIGPSEGTSPSVGTSPSGPASREPHEPSRSV